MISQLSDIKVVIDSFSTLIEKKKETNLKKKE